MSQPESDSGGYPPGGSAYLSGPEPAWPALPAQRGGEDADRTWPVPGRSGGEDDTTVEAGGPSRYAALAGQGYQGASSQPPYGTPVPPPAQGAPGGYGIPSPQPYPPPAPQPFGAPGGYPSGPAAGYPPTAQVSGFQPPPTTVLPVVPGGQPRGAGVRKVLSQPVLAALAVLLLLVSGVVTTLYVSSASDNNRLSANLRDRNRTISTQQSKIDDLNKQVQTTKDDLEKAQTSLQGSQNDSKEYKHRIDVISQCLKLLAQAADAADKGDRTTYNAKMKAANPICDEADKYLA